MRKFQPIETEELCEYKCGNKAKFVTKQGRKVCCEYSTQCPTNKLKNSGGGKTAASKKDYHKIYIGLPQETKDKMAWNRNNYSADFSYDGKGSHKKVLIQERGHKCESCGLEEWLSEPIPLELEHCDGNNRNNIKNNLLLLCPNCHAKTKYYRGRNVNTGKLKVTDDQILTELAKGLNNRQILINVGLTPKGGNYDRINRLRYADVAQ